MAKEKGGVSKAPSDAKPRKKEKKSNAREQQSALVKQMAVGVAAFIVLVAVLANLVYSPAKVVSLNIDDSSKLKEVLLAADPWLVQCYTDNPKLDVLALETAKVINIDCLAL
eukprot:2934416-Pyramimonas_sp.AAC.1